MRYERSDLPIICAAPNLRSPLAAPKLRQSQPQQTSKMKAVKTREESNYYSAVGGTILCPLDQCGEPEVRAKSRRWRDVPVHLRRRGAAILTQMGMSSYDRSITSAAGSTCPRIYFRWGGKCR